MLFTQVWGCFVWFLQIASFTSLFASVLHCCIFAIKHCLNQQWSQTLCCWESHSPLEVKSVPIWPSWELGLRPLQSCDAGTSEAGKRLVVIQGLTLMHSSDIVEVSSDPQQHLEFCRTMVTVNLEGKAYRQPNTRSTMSWSSSLPLQCYINSSGFKWMQQHMGNITLLEKGDRRRVEPDVMSSVSTIHLCPYLPGDLFCPYHFKHWSRQGN